METTDKETVRHLEELLKRTNSVVEAYHNASKNVHNRPMTTFFDEAAQVHEKFSAEIREEVLRVGGKANNNTTISSDADRFWSDFASIIVRRNEAGILKNCAKAERIAIEEYDVLLNRPALSEGFKQTLKLQRDRSEQILKEVVELEKKYASD